MKWQPTVLTTTATKSAIAAQRTKIEAIGAKLVAEFIYDKTTHVIAGKRNLPKVLQGIISAKYIVTEAYIDDLARAAQSPGVDDDGETPLPSRLEQDFDGNWPNPMKYIPPSGQEPTPREPEYLKPDPERTSLLEGFTFVFNGEHQHETLEPVLSLAGAKCPLLPIELGVTSAADTAKRIRELAGKASKVSPKSSLLVGL